MDFSIVNKRNINIDYSLCNSEFYDYPDATCHVQDFPTESSVESLFKSVHQCCGFHGYFVFADCQGFDSTGQEYLVSNVQVCNTLSNERYPKKSLNCSGLEILQIHSDSLSAQHFHLSPQNSSVFTVNGSEFSNFCVSYECHPDEEVWTMSADYCAPINIQEMNFQIKKKSSNLDLCCGPEDVLDTSEDGSVTCIQLETLSKRQIDESFDCGIRETFTVFKDVESQEDVLSSSVKCVSLIRQNGDFLGGGISCKKPCNGVEPCFKFCNRKGYEFYNSSYRKAEIDFNISAISDLLLTEDNVEYSASGHTGCSGKQLQYFPEHNCHQHVVFTMTGDVVFLEQNNETLTYNNFCVAPLGPESGKGRFMIQGCMSTNTNKHTNHQFRFYPYLLMTSVGCLVITISIYLLFPPLINHYSKIMLNFSFSLLLAFIVLVVVQKPLLFGLNSVEPDSFVCKLLGHLNQFSFLSAFMWMTIMSKEIYSQLKLYNQQLSMRKVLQQISLGYGVPFSITLVSFLVEVTAPTCAAYRPRFGHK